MSGDAEARDWIARVARGDQKALRCLYDRYNGLLYRFALARLDNAADAADVVNDVMLQLWRGAAARYRGEGRFTTWLLGIAQHKVIDCLRRRGRPDGDTDTEAAQLQLDRQALADYAGDAPGERLIEAARDAGLLRRCLEGLGGALRQAVYLAFFEDRSYAEIAAILECPQGTVKTRIFHARRQLRDCLRRLAGAEPDDGGARPTTDNG